MVTAEARTLANQLRETENALAAKDRTTPWRTPSEGDATVRIGAAEAASADARRALAVAQTNSAEAARCLCNHSYFLRPYVHMNLIWLCLFCARCLMLQTTQFLDPLLPGLGAISGRLLGRSFVLNAKTCMVGAPMFKGKIHSIPKLLHRLTREQQQHQSLPQPNHTNSSKTLNLIFIILEYRSSTTFL